MNPSRGSLHMQGSLTSFAKSLSFEGVFSLAMEADGCFACVYPLGSVSETAAADCLSLDIHSYLGLGSRLSNTMHWVCSSSVPSLITFSMRAVSWPHVMQSQDVERWPLGLLRGPGWWRCSSPLELPSHFSICLLWPLVKKRTCGPFLLCLWFLGYHRRDVHGSALTFPQLTVDGIHRIFCWASAERTNSS